MTKRPELVERGIYSYGNQFYAKYNGKHLGTFATYELAKVAYRHARASTRRGRSPKKTFSHIVIPPVKIRTLEDLSHIEALGHFIVRRKPTAIICLGDWWGLKAGYNVPITDIDFPKLRDELQHGNLAMQTLMSPIEAAIDSSNWLPQQVFCYGERELDLHRMVKNKPAQKKVIGISHLELFGWIIPEDRCPVIIDGILYTHHFYDFQLDVPLMKSDKELIELFEMSYVQAGDSQFSYTYHPNNAGVLRQGLTGGAYNRYESGIFQGVFCLNNVYKGRYDLETVSLNSIISGKAR